MVPNPSPSFWVQSLLNHVFLSSISSIHPSFAVGNFHIFLDYLKNIGGTGINLKDGILFYFAIMR